MWAALFVHKNRTVEVVGFARSELVACAMTVDAAQEQVRQASGDERARERYTKPKLHGCYLEDKEGGVIEVREQTASVATDGWFGSGVSLQDELVGWYHVSHVTCLHPKTPAEVTATLVGNTNILADHPPEPKPRSAYARHPPCPPAPWMGELRQRISGKVL